MATTSFLSRIELKRREDPKKKKGLLDFLRQFGVDVSTNAQTMPQPAPRTLTPDTRPGTTTRYASPESLRILGIERPELAGEPAKTESFYQQLNKNVVGAANTPLFSVGGVSLSAPDIVSLGLLAYGGYQAVTTGIPMAYRALVKTAVTRNTDKLSKETGVILEKETKDNFIDALTDKLVRTQKPSWMTKESIKQIFKPTAKTGVFQPTMRAEATAEDSFKPLVKAELTRIPKFTPGGSAVPGQTVPLANITAQGRAELKPEEMAKGTSVQPGLAGMGEEAAQVEPVVETVPKIATVKPTTTAEEVTAKPTTAPVVAKEPVVEQKPITTPEQPPPPVQPPTAIPQPVPQPQPIGAKFEMADLQDAQTAVDIANKSDLARKFANLPGVRNIQEIFNPSAVANKPAERAVVLRAILRDEGQQKSQAVISHLSELGDQNKVFGKLDAEGRIAEGILRGNLVNDIRTYPNKYRLTPQQKEWVKRADDIEKAKLDFLTGNGIDVRELSFEEGGQYAGRRVYAKINGQGEILDSGYVGAGPGRPGAKTSAEKIRQFASVDEAVRAGYRYLPEDEALYLNVQGAYNRVADKKMAEWLLTQVDWRTTGAPERLILAAEGAHLKLRKSEQLLAALNRAVRGERVPTVTINSIAGVYPIEANSLRNLITRIQAKEKVTNGVKALRNEAKSLIEANKKEFNAAVNARARARETAMSPKYGEASVQSPAFAGKVFTGQNARETANILRQSFEPRFSKAIDNVNKVNAIGRYFALAGDISPMTIQLLFLAGENPKIYGKAAAGMVKAIFDPEFHANYLSKNKSIIDASPNLILSKAGSTEYTEAMGKTGLLKKGPAKVAGAVLEPFQRGFEAALDVAGIELKKAYRHKATTPEATAQIDQFINEFRGLTSSARLGVSAFQRQLETAVLLAPRYNRAIAGLLFDVFQGNLRGDLARKALARGITAVLAVGVAISLAMGESQKEIEEHLDPNSSKLTTWQIAGQNIGPGSKVRSVVKLFAQSVKSVADGEGDKLLEFSMNNPELRFVRGNLSPAVSTSLDLLTGKDYIGDPSRDGALSFTKTVLVENLTPLWLQSLIYEGTTIGQRIAGAAAQFTGMRNYPETEYQIASELRDKYAQSDYQANWKDLNNAQKDDLIRKYADLAQAEEVSKQATLTKGSPEERTYASVTKQAIEKRNGDLDKAAQALLNGKITKYQYDSERGFIRPYYSGARSALWQYKQELDPKVAKQIESKMNESMKAEDKALDAYWEYYNQLLDKSDLPKDWDSINRELAGYLNRLPLKIQDYIQEQKNAWIQDLPPYAKQVELQRMAGIEDETWWDNYRGKSYSLPQSGRSFKAPFLNRNSTSGGFRAPFLK